MKLLLLGDVHGNDSWFVVAAKHAAENGCEYILQLGDFGYFEHIHPLFLSQVSATCMHYGVSVVWVDGNHENHQMLRSTYGPGGSRYNPLVLGFGDAQWWKVRDRVYHAPRGSVWEWGERIFLACGGAYSVDKMYRTEGVSWWPEETITVGDVVRCTDNIRALPHADVVVSHDAPICGKKALSLREDKKHYMTDANRRNLQTIVEYANPSLVVHGHYHRRYSEIATDGAGREFRIEGFNQDGRWNSMGILDTEDLSVVGVPRG